MMPLSDALEAGSRAAAEACLLALRQIAAVQSPSLSPLLHRLADTLETCVLSPDHCDAAGRPMTYEQVTKLTLEPMVEHERERVAEAEAAQRLADDQLQVAQDEVRQTQRALDAQAPRVRGLQGKCTALEMEAANSRREVAELLAEKEELQDSANGDHEARLISLQEEAARYRQAEAEARKREKELRIALEGSVPMEEVAAARAHEDSARADLRAAQLRVKALEGEVAKLRTAILISAATGASALDALKRSNKKADANVSASAAPPKAAGVDAAPAGAASSFSGEGAEGPAAVSVPAAHVPAPVSPTAQASPSPSTQPADHDAG